MGINKSKFIFLLGFVDAGKAVKEYEQRALAQSQAE